MRDRDPSHAETAEAWDVVARRKYRDEMEEHLSVLGAGGHNLLAPEVELLRELLPGADVVHLQCSHGFDALGLLNAGAARVVGIDVSAEMIDQARAKARAIGAEDADFFRADVTALPGSFDGTADLVYTGRGSLPWILDLTAWAETVRRILRPGGHLFLLEGHPLTYLWDRGADHPKLRERVGYFDSEPREEPGFPSSVVARELGDDRPRMVERPWRPGEVVESLIGAGMTVRAFRELPTLFWDQFPQWPPELRERLPNSYAVLARRE